ncbi:unnamed protein product [Musa hybrid cultivar]
MIHCMTIDEDIFIVFFTRGRRDLLVPEHVVYSIVSCRGFLIQYYCNWKGSSCSRTCRLSQQSNPFKQLGEEISPWNSACFSEVDATLGSCPLFGALFRSSSPIDKDENCSVQMEETSNPWLSG